MYRTDKHLWKSPPGKLRDKFTAPATSTMELFETLVNAINPDLCEE